MLAEVGVAHRLNVGSQNGVGMTSIVAVDMGSHVGVILGACWRNTDQFGSNSRKRPDPEDPTDERALHTGEAARSCKRGDGCLGQ